jgi:Ser/Thr protein kinase RdoA (MazF antagonist)
VRRLIQTIDAKSHVTDLGGVMSLNAWLDPAGLVLRVHQPFVSRPRLLALQNVRQRLGSQGLLVPIPLRWRHSTVFRCGNRWAELEAFIPHQRPKPTLNSYSWMFQAMGALHRALAKLKLPVPRPLVATYAPPGTLRRWLPITEAAVRDDPEAADVAQLLRALMRRLRGQWLPETQLPVQLVHGDVRLSNVCRTPNGAPVYFDFGFLACRPRIHDLAYALAYMVLALNGRRSPRNFPWPSLARLIEAYEFAADSRLTPAERKALVPFTAAVPIYHAAIAGFSNDPARQLRSALPFLRLSEWLLEHPEALLN